jgi:hypothetical protein
VSIPRRIQGSPPIASDRSDKLGGTIPLVASRRFEGAITTPEDGGAVVDSSVVPAPARRARPLLIEFGAASLVVGGLTGILGVVGSAGPATPALDMLVVGLDVLIIVVGLLVRAGRAWILAINVVAVALFVEATALPSPFAIVFTTIDAIVLFALIRHRDWFEPPATAESAVEEPTA